ncbi:hypothetical protein ACFL3G_02290 [Planctomycetota bacterium]
MTNNYINLVVLGNFNPSILTHDFLVTECEFDLESEPVSSSPPVPVISSLDYSNVSFLADLGRLQITENNCKNPKQSKLPMYLKRYLAKLHYTPITKCGANFNYNVEVQKIKIGEIEQKLLKDRQFFCKALKADEIGLEIALDISSDSETVKNWTLRTMTQSGESSTTMNVSTAGEPNTVKINFNYEINLEQERNRIKKITDDYAKVYELFLFQLRKLFEENKS